MQGVAISKLACRILLQVSSSSCTERVWSTFSLVQSKVRNKLTSGKAKKLVFIHSSIRLLERLEDADYSDRMHKSEEDSDPEDEDDRYYQQRG